MSDKYHASNATRDTLNKALTDIISQKKKISISAVARMAGVHPSLIHNKYPDIAEAIRLKSGTSAKCRLNVSRDKLVESHLKIKDLRDEIRNLQIEVKKLASINESLRRKFSELDAIANGKNIYSISSLSNRPLDSF